MHRRDKIISVQIMALLNLGMMRRSYPHPKSLSLRERDFESGSLLPEGAVRYGRGSPAHISATRQKGWG